MFPASQLTPHPDPGKHTGQDAEDHSLGWVDAQDGTWETWTPLEQSPKQLTLIPYHHLLLPTSPWLALLTATIQVSQVRKLRRGELEWIIQE